MPASVDVSLLVAQKRIRLSGMVDIRRCTRDRMDQPRADFGIDMRHHPELSLIAALDWVNLQFMLPMLILRRGVSSDQHSIDQSVLLK